MDKTANGELTDIKTSLKSAQHTAAVAETHYISTCLL